MSIVTFPFEPDLFVNPETIALEVQYRPYVLVKLQYKKIISKNFIRALVDSGADYNLFPASFGRELGITLTRGKKHKTTGVGGNSFYVYLHLVTMNLGKKKFPTVIAFADEVTIPLLGRNGFFNYFKSVSFHVKEKTLELQD